MMRNDWQNMYTAATDVMNSGQYNLNTPYDVIFTDEGENSSESVFELQCASTAALPASDKIGSQFCEVQGVRGSGQWDLGWGWHMGTELMGEAFEPGDPAKMLRCFTSVVRILIRSLPRIPTNLMESLRYLKPTVLILTRKLIPTRHSVKSLPGTAFG